MLHENMLKHMPAEAVRKLCGSVARKGYGSMFFPRPRKLAEALRKCFCGSVFYKFLVNFLFPTTYFRKKSSISKLFCVAKVGNTIFAQPISNRNCMIFAASPKDPRKFHMKMKCKRNKHNHNIHDEISTSENNGSVGGFLAEAVRKLRGSRNPDR